MYVVFCIHLYEVSHMYLTMNLTYVSCLCIIYINVLHISMLPIYVCCFLYPSLWGIAYVSYNESYLRILLMYHIYIYINVLYIRMLPLYVCCFLYPSLRGPSHISSLANSLKLGTKLWLGNRNWKHAKRIAPKNIPNNFKMKACMLLICQHI